MDSLGWLVVIVLILLFGKSGLFNGSLSLGLANQKPTPDGIPFISDQNQNAENTANAPPPWAQGSQCASQEPAPVNYANNPVVASTSQLPSIAPRNNVRFYQ